MTKRATKPKETTTDVWVWRNQNNGDWIKVATKLPEWRAEYSGYFEFGTTGRHLCIKQARRLGFPIPRVGSRPRKVRLTVSQ